MVCRIIEREAKKSGFGPKDLEQLLKVGRGDGRRWRDWRIGTVPAAEVRHAVLHEASCHGWLNPSPEQADRLACIAEFHTLPMASEAISRILLDFVPPDPPNHLYVGNPRLAAGRLVMAARDWTPPRSHKDRPSPVRHPHSLVVQQIERDRQRSRADWVKAMDFVTGLLARFDELVVLAILERAYANRWTAVGTEPGQPVGDTRGQNGDTSGGKTPE